MFIYFFDTIDTIPASQGFSLFGPLHLIWLFLFLFLAIGLSLLYRKLTATGRRKFRRILALLLLADEGFKIWGLITGGHYTADYLPFHLCSINIFLIAIHAWKSHRVIDNFLYAICIPAAIAALLFPTWTSLPLTNFMHLHSFTVHILLALYPIVLTASGDIHPELRLLPKCLGLLAMLALLALGINLALDTNFMFLMYAPKGNPLYWFEQATGSHLLGFPVLIALIILVMYGGRILFTRITKRISKN